MFAYDRCVFVSSLKHYPISLFFSRCSSSILYFINVYQNPQLKYDLRVILEQILVFGLNADGNLLHAVLSKRK